MLSPLPPPVFSPRVVGTAVARYDFSSRDTRELSLVEGDVVKIYSKMSNGWWRGDISGRVGTFWLLSRQALRTCSLCSRQHLFIYGYAGLLFSLSICGMEGFNSPFSFICFCTLHDWHDVFIFTFIRNVCMQHDCLAVFWVLGLTSERFWLFHPDVRALHRILEQDYPYLLLNGQIESEFTVNHIGWKRLILVNMYDCDCDYY